MLNIRRSLLVAVGLAAALALVPAGAAAQPSVEVIHEETGIHCDDVVPMQHHLPATDPECSLHVFPEGGTATWDLFQHTGLREVPFSSCQMEFEAAIGEIGHVWIYDQVITPEGGSCGREPCDEAETGEGPHRNFVWEGRINEAGPSTAERETLRMTLCLRAHSVDSASEGGGGTSCTLDLVVQRTGVSHDLHIASPPHDGLGNGGAPCINLGGSVEVETAWETAPTEGHPNQIEIHHLDDEVG